jgi:UDP-N-acetylmuramate--alanine ligase
MTFSDYRRVHFVGIGGIGMSALARLLLARSIEVSGSDRAPNEQIVALSQLGARVMIGHRAENIGDADLVVVTSAAGSDNPEIAEARSRGLPVIKRARLLGDIADSGRAIAVAGTHGKTTTSALVGWILTQAELSPTVLVGGIVKTWGSNAQPGHGDWVVVEADEYDASFLELRPEFAVITNVEAEHLDFFGTEDQMRAAFLEFARGVRGALVIDAEEPNLLHLVRDVSARVISYGLEIGDWQAHEISFVPSGVSFRAVHGEEEWVLGSPLSGLHNVRNALAAVIIARELSVPCDVLQRALASFPGIERRAEIKGETNGIVVVDDYAHHPTEIRATLAALKQRFGRPLRVIFQPHTYSRTKHFFDGFASAFADADAVYLLEIYAAREHDDLGISGRDLAEAVAQFHPRVRYAAEPEHTLDCLVADAKPGDLVVTMGAGDVYQLGPRLLQRLADQ